MDFSDFIFYLKMFKINKKSAKSARVPRGCDVAHKATWQSHADPRNAYLDLKGIQPLNPSGFINPTTFYNFSRVGLIHTLLTLQVTWRNEERWIGGASEDPRVDRVDADH